MAINLLYALLYKYQIKSSENHSDVFIKELIPSKGIVMLKILFIFGLN